MELGDRQPGDPPLPADLQAAVDEWVTYAGAVARSGRPEELELLRRRGRQLASRVSGVLGRPVEFVDPVNGAVEHVTVGTGPLPRLREPTGPTPWGTGLVISGFTGVFVALADVTLCWAFADAFGAVWVPANLLVCFGLAPSLWLMRRFAVWRWFAYGAAAGLAAAWIVLLLGSLGPG
ncbi:Protein of unknown function [Pseudonocardia thermophila]|uniref:DUF2537 domain-containing protein n=1 Tax=Pseudonocardia thermophila TaxID=1848 RepID=A0A1M6YK72_PSETH|nr:DUF2537 domain-containing protein [Pseudonocardia thermophila]SHL18666.1 Protein of unknown function [Pseudonocardia thermophila]